jgi:hypothetical protein
MIYTHSEQCKYMYINKLRLEVHFSSIRGIALNLFKRSSIGIRLWSNLMQMKSIFMQYCTVPYRTAAGFDAVKRNAKFEHTHTNAVHLLTCLHALILTRNSSKPDRFLSLCLEAGIRLIGCTFVPF